MSPIKKKAKGKAAKAAPKKPKAAARKAAKAAKAASSPKKGLKSVVNNLKSVAAEVKKRLGGKNPDLKNRDPKFLAADVSALKALCQAAINVELFTIPLYMNSMYSIYGMHAIEGGNDFYKDRLWPGAGKKANPKDANEDAFNKMFSVFIAEMLHLQLASNIANSAGVHPNFTSPLLVNGTYGWTCYGPNETTIPHIIDFQDCTAEYQDIRVNTGPLTYEQNRLFIAIEETEEMAEQRIRPEVLKKGKYFPATPFADWSPTDTEQDLPMFGSIGYMYKCLWDYLNISYSDKTTLWEQVYRPGSLQQDLFNIRTQGHPKKEYPTMVAIVQDGPEIAKLRIWNMITAITDQGEGSGISGMLNAPLGAAPQQVSVLNRPSDAALLADYNAADVAARGGKNAAMDHLEIFQYIAKLLKPESGPSLIQTWDQWHAAGNVWNENMLQTPAYKAKYPIPTPKEVADALNALKKEDAGGKNYKQISQASCGAIAGITTVLNDFWTNMKTQFPFPSMGGSGDRVSICWAIFGKGPDFSLGIPPKKPGQLYHACQGMNMDPNVKEDANLCAAIEVYHTCKGSNTCKAEGGCGFVQNAAGGGNCSQSVMKFVQPHDKGTCNPFANGQFSPPSDNKCGAFGGCAVPISASQLYPKPTPDVTTMQMYTFGPGPEFKSELAGVHPYKVGDSVYDTAWTIYEKVMTAKGKKVGRKPKPSHFRLAFPPST